MTLRVKILLTMVPLALVVGLAMKVSGDHVITGGFSQVESRLADGQSRRISDAVEGAQRTLAQLTRLQAVWDDPYELLRSGDGAGFVGDYPPGEMWAGYRVSDIVVLDPAGKLVAGGSTAGGDAFGALPPAIAEDLAALAGTEPRCGLWRTDSLLMFCSNPVLHTDGTGPAAGTLVLFQPLDAEALSTISEQLGLPVSIAAASDHPITQATGSDSMTIAVTVAVGNDSSGAILTATTDRPVNVQAERTRRNVLAATVVLAVVFLVAMLVLTERLVLRRVRRASGALRELATGESGVRLDVAGHDELSVLAANANLMIDVLHHREAVARDEEARSTERLALAESTVDEGAALLADAERSRAEAAGLVASAAAAVLAELSSVSERAGELEASTGRIGGLVDDSAALSSEALGVATTAQGAVGELRDTTQTIEELARLIASIAEETNLLALNASIEAARAGDAGRGFSVVAGEVKELSRRTADSTRRIESDVQAMRQRVGAIEVVIASIDRLSHRLEDAATGISAVTDEQRAVTAAVGSSVERSRRRIEELVARSARAR